MTTTKGTLPTYQIPKQRNRQRPVHQFTFTCPIFDIPAFPRCKLFKFPESKVTKLKLSKFKISRIFKITNTIITKVHRGTSIPDLSISSVKSPQFENPKTLTPEMPNQKYKIIIPKKQKRKITQDTQCPEFPMNLCVLQ